MPASDEAGGAKGVVTDVERVGLRVTGDDVIDEFDLSCMENAFRHIGGVTVVVIVDNLKSAVLEPDWFDPQLNPKMADFAAHYGTVILPTEPALIEHKGEVEAGIKYAQKNAGVGRVFTSFGD